MKDLIDFIKEDLLVILLVLVCSVVAVATALILINHSTDEHTETCRERFGDEWYYSNQSYAEDYCVNEKTGERKFI